MNDVTKINRTNKSTVTTSPPAVEEKGSFVKVGSFFGNLFNYGFAGLKVIDVMARICTAAALYLKLDDALLNWGAGFLAVTAVWEIVVALLRANGPNRK